MPARILRSVALTALLLFAFGCEEEKLRTLDPQERLELEKVFLDARTLDESGRYHEALVRYETILGTHPEFISTRLNAAMAAYDSGQYQKAADHFEILHKAGPNDWFVLRKLIQCYERLGREEPERVYRAKLEKLRQQKGSVILRSYEGLTRDYIPMGSMHLIGYEFFEPKKHGRLWLFKLEDKAHTTVTTFLLEATAYHDNSGKRLFCLSEANRGFLNIWYIGEEGRDYRWARDFATEALQGKREPLSTRPLPPDYVPIAIPEVSGPPIEDPLEKSPRLNVSPLDPSTPKDPNAKVPTTKDDTGLPEPAPPAEPPPVPQPPKRARAR